MNAIAIRFCDGAAVPIEKAFSYADAYDGERGYVSPVGVIWEDGFESFGKGWWDTSVAGCPLVRIGAGAYGDMLILERKVGE